MLDATREIRQALYNNFDLISLYVILIYQYLHFSQKQRIPSYCIIATQSFFYKRPQNKLFAFLSKDYLWIIFENFLMVSYIQSYGVFNRPFGNLVGTGANYFSLLFFNGALYILYCCVVGINPLKQLDFATPSYPLALIFAKIGCFIFGCCYGIEWQHGMYNHYSGRYEVPVQLIEILWALLIFIFMMFYKKKAKTGTLFPIYLILFSSTRFFSEFLRREDNVLGILKVYHILCIIGVVVGVIGLIIVNKFGDRINAHFEKNYRGIIGVIVKKIKKAEDKDMVVPPVKPLSLATIKEEIEKYKKKGKKGKGRIKF